jgi:uncharacterized protein YbjT (DUF2867 family)
MNCLVTGATGNIGTLVTERLIARGERPRVFARDPKKARALFGDRVEIRVGDLADADSLANALLGIDSVFLLNSGTELGARDRGAASVAKAAGVRHIVKLSTLDVRTGVGTGSWHADGEDAIRASGVAFTFIQSAAFMSNALGWALAIHSLSVLRCSTGEGKIAFIHPVDIADVATHTLMTRAHEGKSLVITGPVALSYGEMAARIGDAIGRSVRFDSISDAQARKMALAWADSRAYAEALVDIWRAVREGRLSTVSDGVERIVGRKPISFEQWAAENADAFR